MPAPVDVTLVFLSDAMTLTGTRRDRRDRPSARVPGRRTGIAPGPLQSAADDMTFDHPHRAPAKGRHRRGCSETPAPRRHLQSAVADVPETTKEARR